MPGPRCVSVCVTSRSAAPSAAGSDCRRPSLLCTLFAQHVTFHGVSRAAHSSLWDGAVVCAHAAHSLFGASALELLQHLLPGSTAPLTSVV